MDEEKELLGLMAALIVEVSFKEPLHEIVIPSCYTTLKLSDEITKVFYGYRLRKLNGETHIVIHEKEAVIVRKIFRDFLKGVPIAVIHDEVKQMGFPKTGLYAIHKILSNCFYAGLTQKSVADEDSKILIKTFHPSIINEADFHAAQRSLHSESASQAKHLESMPLKGALKCSCGDDMTAAWHKGKNQYYLYYRCLTHKQTAYSGQRLHEQCSQLLKQLVLKKDQIDYLTKKVEEILDNVLSEHKKMMELKSTELREADLRLSRINEKISNHEINQEVFSKWHKKLTLEKNIINADLKTIDKNLNSICSSAYQQLSHLSNIETLYNKADYQQKQLLIKEIFKGGFVYSNNRFMTDNINCDTSDLIRQSG